MTDELKSTDAPPVAFADTSARCDIPSHLRLWLIAAFGLVADLWTKHWAFSTLPPDEVGGRVVIPRLMSFHRSLNSGALFGLGKGYTLVFIIASILALAFVLFLFIHSGKKRWSLHIALGLVLAGALGNLYDRAFSIADVVHYTIKNPTSGDQSVALVGKIVNDTPVSLTLASWPDGQRPRTIPKMRNPTVRSMGVVRDFIRMEPSITIGKRQIDIWPWVFNIADALLVFGVALLMLNFWFERKHHEPIPPAQTDAVV